MADQPTSDVIDRIRSVRPPRRGGPRLDEATLTRRQRQLLDELGGRFDEGFAHLTMAELAASLRCSLRTLYAIAPSRDTLVVTVIDRNLRTVGRRAVEAVTADMGPLEAIQAYLATANAAGRHTTTAFARDLQQVPAATATHDAHDDHLVVVTRRLLDLAVERDEIAPVDTYAVARVIASLGRDLADPEVLPRLDRSPSETADEIVAVMIRGLRA